MATQVFVRKFNNALCPADGFGIDAIENLKVGIVYKCEITASRNYKFLQKAFVLVNYAFEVWEPPTNGQLYYKGQEVEKDLEGFRDYLTILAGYYRPTYLLDGSVRLKAKSWSYKEMPDDQDFSQLYSKLIDVIFKKVLSGYTGEQLDEIVNNLLGGFA